MIRSTFDAIKFDWLYLDRPRRGGGGEDGRGGGGEGGGGEGGGGEGGSDELFLLFTGNGGEDG